MNTISIHAEAHTASFQVAKPLGAIDFGIPRQRPPATWLPAPVARPIRSGPAKRTCKARTPAMPSWRESGGEKLLFGLLILAATLAVGYGFSCLVDLVQNWALFGAGVGRLLQ